MMLTVDISMYPLKDDYLTPIKWFIERLAAYPNIQRKTNALATQICGPFDEVMHMLSAEMQAAHEAFGQAVFVCKFLPGERELDYVDRFGAQELS